MSVFEVYAFGATHGMLEEALKRQRQMLLLNVHKRGNSRNQSFFSYSHHPDGPSLRAFIDKVFHTHLFKCCSRGGKIAVLRLFCQPCELCGINL
jgi:hypothetical protein